MKLTDQEVKDILAKAEQDAVATTAKYLSDIGGDTYPCGFAWVHIKPARGQFVKIMKELKMGRTDEFYGGYVVYNPSGNFCQNMDAKYEGAKAFANELKRHGVNATAIQRID